MSTFNSSELWFNGPHWLPEWENTAAKPHELNKEEISIKEEVQKEAVKEAVVLSIVTEDSSMMNWINKYSSFEYLLIIFSWIVRFADRCRKLTTLRFPYITLSEKKKRLY